MKIKTTSSTTSDRPSSESSTEPSSRKALAAWLVVAGIQIALSFTLRGGDGESGNDAIYRYDFAIGSLVFYGFLVALTFWIASAYPSARASLGLGRFAARWLGTTVGVIIASAILARVLEPILHAGEEQGLAPDVWRSDRALPFAVNGLVIVTVVPFAEELFFRGLGVRVFAGFGAPAAIAVTAVLFGLAHGIPVALPVLVFLAAGLAWVRFYAGSVWPGIIAHSAYNGIGVLFTYFTIQ